MMNKFKKLEVQGQTFLIQELQIIYVDDPLPGSGTWFPPFELDWT